MWLYLLIIAFVVIWLLTWRPEGEYEPEGYEWMGKYMNQ
jgi:hypothetical protein